MAAEYSYTSRLHHCTPLILASLMATHLLFTSFLKDKFSFMLKQQVLQITSACMSFLQSRWVCTETGRRSEQSKAASWGGSCSSGPSQNKPVSGALCIWGNTPDIIVQMGYCTLTVKKRLWRALTDAFSWTGDSKVSIVGTVICDRKG